MTMKFDTDVERQLWEDYAVNGDNRRLQEYYVPLVKYLAGRFAAKNPIFEQDDFTSCGAIGLVDAIDKFDQSRGILFRTFCVRRICGAMYDYLRAADHVSRHTRKVGQNWIGMHKLACQAVGRNCNHVDIAEMFELSDDHISQFEHSNRLGSGTSIEAMYQNPKIRFYGIETQARVTCGQPPDVAYADLCVLRKACKGLNQRERLLIILYYWLGQSMKEVGKHIGLSESRVSQMHSSIIERYKNMFTLEGV